MSIECVIDSSSIISLCKCGLESFLKKSGWKFISVKEIFHEVVERGFAEGYVDALAAKKLFDEGVITLAEIKGKIPELLTPDEKVIELAKERKAVVLSNDQKLGRKAVGMGVVAFRSAGLCGFLAKKGLITKNQFNSAVMLLV